MTNKTLLNSAVFAACICLATSAQAAPTEVEGAAGGGIVPWALLAPASPTVSFTYVGTGAYSLTSLGVSGTIMKRLELSYARASFDTEGVGLGIINLDTFGAKYKITGMSANLPQIAVGIQYKKNQSSSALKKGGVPYKNDSGTDYYIAATKVLSIAGHNVLLDGTLRYTRANQIGILGFGATKGNGHDGYSLHFEGSAGVFLTANSEIGVEYRSKPDNLSALKENDWWDVHFAYFPNKQLSVVVAYANLGNIVSEVYPQGKNQRGLYLQVQENF